MALRSAPGCRGGRGGLARGGSPAARAPPPLPPPHLGPAPGGAVPGLGPAAGGSPQPPPRPGRRRGGAAGQQLAAPPGRRAEAPPLTALQYGGGSGRRSDFPPAPIGPRGGRARLRVRSRRREAVALTTCRTTPQYLGVGGARGSAHTAARESLLLTSRCSLCPSSAPRPRVLAGGTLRQQSPARLSDLPGGPARGR